MCVITVFSLDSSNPLSAINSSTIGSTPFSRSSFVSPVIIKSSAYLIKFTFGKYAFPFIFVLWYFAFSFASNPSSTMLQITGEIAEPCGLPCFVGNSFPVSIYPHFSHLRRISLSNGILFKIHSWLMLSKHPLMSPSSTHFGDFALFRLVKHCSIASCVHLPILKP